MSIGFCPRCGERSYEVLRTHSFCINCNYYPEIESTQIDQRIFIDPESQEFLSKVSRRLKSVL